MSLINSFKTDTITVTRYEAGSYTKGRYQTGTQSSFPIEAVVIPLKGKEHELLSEGERAKQSIRVYSKEALFTGDDKTGKKADILEIGGLSFEVKQVQNWGKTDLDHYRVVAVEIENNPNERILN